MLGALAVVLLAAAPAWGAGAINVVTSSTDLKALVEAVGRDAVRVVSLAPAVHEPHAVPLKPGQLAELKAAALLVRVGLDHEPWLDQALATLDDPRLSPGGEAVLDCSKGLELIHAERQRRPMPPAAHALGNPHYWLDPDNARPITAGIRDALARLVPAARQRFENNRTGFLTMLDERLERWSRALAPHRGTRVVTVHDAWPYFARRFGLVVVGTVEPAPGVSPSPAQLDELIARMRSAGARLVIGGAEDNAAMVSLVAARGGARPVTLISSVGADAEARSYLGLFDVDVKRLTQALAPR